MLLKFADQVLSREELKAVRGASGCAGSCGHDGKGTCYYSGTTGGCRCGNVAGLVTTC